MKIFIASFLFVVLAEMGDKTQLLAMAFATRFPARTVLAGVLVATLANHLLAVVVGSWLTHVVPLDAVQVAVACPQRRQRTTPTRPLESAPGKSERRRPPRVRPY